MCGPLFLTVASVCLLSVGTCLGFLTAALFATGVEPAQLIEDKMVASMPDETSELVWQAAESLYILASCLREGEDSFGPMADAARALRELRKVTGGPENLVVTTPEERSPESTVKVSKASVATRTSPKA
jgi:hypothetical protein